MKFFPSKGEIACCYGRRSRTAAREVPNGVTITQEEDFSHDDEGKS